MSFLDDLLDNEPTLAQATVNDDPLVYELIANAAREGSIDTLRSAITRGQIDASAPLALVVDIIGIAGNSSRPKLQKMSLNEVQSRMDFLQEWVELTSPKDPQARQERLDFLLQACFVSIFKFHDASAQRLLKMGANPMVAIPVTSAIKVIDNTDKPDKLATLVVAAQPAGTPELSGSTLDPITARSVAIIGTAGRDKAMPMTKELWAQMVDHARLSVRQTDTLVSGGAAWADHLAVAMFLEGRVNALTLHLPAPMNASLFAGPDKSAASAANYYHSMFKKNTGVDGGKQILEAISLGAKVTYQPQAPGYAAMFSRNALVAKGSDSVIAYTFGTGDEPADGGTKNTWDQMKGDRVHVPLGDMPAQIAKAEQLNQSNQANSGPKSVPSQAMKVVDGRIYHATPKTPPGHQALAFARLGLSQVVGTTLSTAIYAKSSVSGAMVAALAGKLGEKGLPTVAILALNTSENEKPFAIDVNPLAFAIAIGETSQVNAILTGLPHEALGSQATQTSLAKAIVQVKSLGLHFFGPDEVHHGIAKILSFIVDPLKAFADAEPSFAHEFVNASVIAVESPSLKYFDAEGVIIDGEKSLSNEDVSKAKRISMAMAILSTPEPSTVVGALTAFKQMGWKPNEACSFALDGATGGATIAHFAAMRGDLDILASLRAIGCDLKVKDAMGRSPAAYAFASISENNARNFQVASFIDPDEAIRLQAQRKELRAQSSSAPDLHPLQRSHLYVQEMLHVPGFPQAHTEGPGAQAQGGGSASHDGNAPSSNGFADRGSSKEDAQKVTGGEGGKGGAVDMDSVNEMLAIEAAERNHDFREAGYGAFEERAAQTNHPSPSTPEPAVPAKPVRSEVHTKTSAMFANFKNLQSKAREVTGKPLGMTAAPGSTGQDHQPRLPSAAEVQAAATAAAAAAAKGASSSSSSAASKFKRL